MEGLDSVSGSSFDKVSLPTLVIGELGVSHLGNDRTDNPFFRGQTVSLKGRQMRIKLVRALNARCFPALLVLLVSSFFPDR